MATEQQEFDQAANEAFQDRVPPELTGLSHTLLIEFGKAQSDRRLTEERWLKDLRQYRGVYDPEVLELIGPTRSKSFLKKTRVKVKTIDSRVADLLFPAGSEKNWNIDSTPSPNISPEQRQHIIAMLKQQQMELMQAQAQQQGQPLQRGQIPPLSQDVIDQAVKKFISSAAKGMSTAIEDQLSEAKYKDVCIRAVHSGHLFGLGIVKGPLVERRTRTRFMLKGRRWVTEAEQYVIPFLDFVPVWRFYPDMNSTKLQQCRYVWERHMMTAPEMFELSERKTFKGELIKDYIKSHPRGEVRQNYIDNQLKILGDRQANQGGNDGLYEVLERWGWLLGSELAECGIDVPPERMAESFFLNVWMLPNGSIIKSSLQPINGVTWPYHLYSFDQDDTSIFPEGVASIMRDDQTNLNAAQRMILDNAALTSGPMLEVITSLLSEYDRADEIAPWKIWSRNQQMPGTPAIRAIELPSHIAELSAMKEMFEANSDEVSAIPRYMTGENATQGAAGTAAGMSMLMGAANIVIKDLVTSWDEGVTRPFLEAMYRWNMQFNPDSSIKGDFAVQARGTSSLVAKEVRTRQLNEFGALTANPMDAPYIKRDVLNRLRAEANEMTDVVKTQEEVEKEQQTGAAQMQAMMQQIQLATAQAQLANLQADAAKKEAEAIRIQAEAALARAKEIDLKVSSVYAALQAGGVATMSPQTAPAGDEILRSAGWVDQTPDPTIAQLDGPAVQQGAQMPAPPMNPATGHMGEHEGIETTRVTDGS